MDVHKPKLLHNWREFLIEIGTIVIGVLIALAAEQTAEAVHWHYQAAQAEAAIGDELHRNFVYMAEREEIDPCIRKRIVELRDKLLQPGTQWKADPQILGGPVATVFLPSYSTSHRSWIHDAWTTAISNNAVSHMSADRVATYAAIYRGIDRLNEYQEAEFDVEEGMVALNYDLVLSPDKRQDYLNMLGRLDAFNFAIVTIGQQSLAHGAAIGLGPKKADIALILANQRQYRGACVVDPKLPLVE
jgi:hypothetical protein